MDRAMGHHPQGKGLEGGVRVWVGEESGQVVWGQEKDRFSISDQGPEGVPEGSLESWRFVSYSSMRFIFEKESHWQPCGVWVEGPASKRIGPSGYEKRGWVLKSPLCLRPGDCSR